MWDAKSHLMKNSYVSLIFSYKNNLSLFYVQFLPLAPPKLREKKGKTTSPPIHSLSQELLNFLHGDEAVVCVGCEDAPSSFISGARCDVRQDSEQNARRWLHHQLEEGKQERKLSRISTGSNAIFFNT